MATENAAKPQNQSSDYTIALYRLIHVLTAGWRKPASLIRQKQKLEDPRIKGQVPLIKPNGAKDSVFHGILFVLPNSIY